MPPDTPIPSDLARSGTPPGRLAMTQRSLRGVRELRLAGRGRIVLHLFGTGHVSLRRGRLDDFCFEGRGLPKHLSAEEVQLDGATGVLTLEGTELVLEFVGGTANADIQGEFASTQRGGELGPPAGLASRTPES